MDRESAIQKAKKGDHESFVALITSMEQSLYRISSSILQNDADCADAIQETIIKAYSSIDKLREPQFFQTWLIRILINQCNKMINQRKKVMPLIQAENHSILTDFTQVEIQEAIHRLEEPLRLVTVLYYIEDLSVKSIADLLECPEGTVKSRLSRARSILMKWFQIDTKESSR
ncbi:RNA polymerase sigma factor [Shimazuella kribbensis]|uniref:RNA polymerase sigma factor n=1 Tax=Shimazuella kribbensis TaxID=139808 RepID=UPI000400CA00|nr:sigma-70 family RNA polymerase sigma factor [Shimazuella kribbensis]